MQLDTTPLPGVKAASCGAPSASGSAHTGDQTLAGASAGDAIVYDDFDFGDYFDAVVTGSTTVTAGGTDMSSLSSQHVLAQGGSSGSNGSFLPFPSSAYQLTSAGGVGCAAATGWSAGAAVGSVFLLRFPTLPGLGLGRGIVEQPRGDVVGSGVAV